ncbi:IS6 family transposase [Halostagnicola sp. A56]|uniref:IS6 family transposase n=1 Tax=Halostagnicola sp. A56 TaxID=1495067 RepID=UPI0009E4ED83|nr:IS6 family transposase [Halostagnicola sp. A56]
MLLSDLLRKSYTAEFDECWERERTATLARVFAVRLHSTGCSIRETQAILRLVGVERSHQAIWYWVHRLADSVPDPPRASPSRVAVDETAVKINGDWPWVYAAIDLDSWMILNVVVFGRRGTDPAAASLHRVTKKHDLDDTVFLVDCYGYLTALSRLRLGGQLDYVDRNLIEKRFHTLKMRVDRFHNSWVGSRASVRDWLEQFVHYYNTQRPHQSLNGQTSAEVLN